MSMDTNDTRPQREVEHYVDPAPFNPAVTEDMTAEQERFFQASQWQIMWWKFKRHKIAVWSGVILILFYMTVPFAEVIAPYTANQRDSLHLYAPPQPIHLFHEGEFVGPFVYGMTSEIDMETLQWVFEDDLEQVQPIRFFCFGNSTSSGGCSPRPSTCSARRKAGRCSCSAPTVSAATSSRVSSTARACRSLSA
jgi:peptide/nickel transport system permease protein